MHTFYAKQKLNFKREGSFEARIIKNYENDISGIEEKIIGMYSKSVSTQDISSHINSIYGIEL